MTTTLLELNNFSDGTFTFTDNRPSDVLFSFPTARDITATITQQTFAAERRIDIIEVIKPADARCSYSIDVSAVPGATVSWSVVPSGCSISIYNQVYTIDGIDSKEIWDQVAAPTITVPATFFGSFFYISTINYTNNSTPKTKQWQVGLYIPETICEAVTTLTCDASKVFGSAQLSFPMVATFVPVILDLLLVARASIVAQSRVDYVSPAASLTSTATIQEQGEVTPQPLAPYLSATNPNNDTTNTTDHFVTDIEVDSTYVLVGARAEDQSSNNEAGIAYVFNKSTGALVYTLTNPSAGPFPDYFGTSVAITDNYFVVGAPQEQNDSFSDGTVYAFNKSDGTLANTINNTVTGNSQYFGMNVETIDSANDIVAVASPGESSVYYNVDCDAGTIGNKITQTDLVDTSNVDEDQLGAYDGWFIAGAPDNRTVYVYQGSTLEHTINVTDNATLGVGRFGSAVAISNSYFAVAAYNHDNGAGKIWVFNRATGSQVYTIDNPDIGSVYGSYTPNFGKFIKMTDDYLFVSTNESVRNDVNGRVWVFDTATGNQLTKKIYPPTTLSSEATPPSYYPFFGNVFAFDGTDRIIVGDRETEKGTKI